MHGGAFAGCAQCHWPELRAHFFLNFAMSSSSGAAQSSKAIGLIAEYLKKPENQAEAMAVWLKLSSGGFKETTVHLGSAGAGRFTPLYV